MRLPFLSFLLDFIAAPRKTEQLVRTLSLDELYSLALPGNQTGVLPYHDERVRALVWELKYYANARAATLAAAILHEPLVAIATEEVGIPLLIPVPMHKKRKRTRGHNQTEVLSQALLPHVREFFVYAPHALMRTAHAPQQQGLEKHTRLSNVAGSMQADPTLVARRVCVVLDDVVTSGATFNEARRALVAAGARRVVCIALAQP